MTLLCCQPDVLGLSVDLLVHVVQCAELNGILDYICLSSSFSVPGQFQWAALVVVVLTWEFHHVRAFPCKVSNKPHSLPSPSIDLVAATAELLQSLYLWTRGVGKCGNGDDSGVSGDGAWGWLRQVVSLPSSLGGSDMDGALPGLISWQSYGVTGWTEFGRVNQWILSGSSSLLLRLFFGSGTQEHIMVESAVGEQQQVVVLLAGSIPHPVDVTQGDGGTCKLLYVRYGSSGIMGGPSTLGEPMSESSSTGMDTDVTARLSP
ncbi:hypothetical protein Tco_0259863 [Tanacetum coccineum]